MRLLRRFFLKYPSFVFSLTLLAASFVCQIPLPGGSFTSLAHANDAPSADDINGLMNKLLDSSLSETEKQRIAAVVFYHTDTYRSAVIHERFPADSPQIQAFLKYKGELQVDVLQRMSIKYKNKYGTALKQPLIPFSYNNIFSDDDIITGTGKTGRTLESLYNESLSEILEERAGRPMTAADRKRIDVNGLAWNMTQEGAFEDFKHKEKYVNPQSGYANQEKLIEGAEKNKVVAYTSDDEGRLVRMSPEETVAAIKRLDVDRPLEIPGIDVKKGAGSMSDFLRMADMHQVKFVDGRAVTDEDIIQFIRNQKYSQRVIDPFREIGAAVDPELAQKYARFMEISDALRGQTTARGVAQILEAEYKVKIIDPNGIIDFNKLGEAMKVHQTLQLTEALPQMMGSVTKSEVFKISEWLKSAGKNDRLMLRKQMALTYAPLTDGQRATILSQIEAVSEIEEADKAFVRRALDGDAKQIRRYADLLELEASVLTGKLKLTGDNYAVVDFVIGKNAKVRALTDAIGSRPGGSRFNEFLKSKTAKALNLDVMLDFSGENKGQKFMQWSMILLAATRAYEGATDEKEGLKQMGIAIFQMIPFVASGLRFSEGEYREAFKEFAMDIFPPLALANLAVMGLGYTAQAAKSSWDDTVWEGLVREAMRDLNDDDFEKTDMGYYRLKEREAYFEYIKEVAPGMGRVAKLASMVEPEVEALMSRNEEFKTNLAALYTLQWFEKFDEESQTTYWAKQFDIDQIKNRVWQEGQLSKGSASPVERVAAKILLDNMAIRLEMQNRVLSKFIDRIEERYNDLKGEVTGECSPPGMIGSAMEMVTGPDEQECDPNAIVVETMAVLKSLYENAPAEVRDSPWGLETLEEEYSRILGYLQGYSPQGKSQLDIRKEMQEIIDGFKAFINDLVFGVALYQEAQTLNLNAHLYGGDNEYDETEEILLGDSFRLGISARVSPIHRGERNWKVFYYAAGPADASIKLIGEVSLNSKKYDPGTEGLWEIEDPDKDTVLNIRRGDIIGKFDQEGPYQIVAVIAFGGWSDPIGQVGYAALRNPIEHAQSFAPDKVAFASPALDFTAKRAELTAKPQKTLYPSDEIPEVAFYLTVPEYAQAKGAKAEFSATSLLEDKDPECYPARASEVSFDSELPSLFSVIISPEAKEGQYLVNVKAEINGLASEFQPYPQVVSFEYTKGEGEQENGQEREQQMSELESLQERSQVLSERASSTYETLDNEVADALKALSGLDKDLRSIDKLIAAVTRKAGAVDDNLALTKKDADQAQIEAEKAAAIRSQVQDHALGCCSFAEQALQTREVAKLKKMIVDVRQEDEQVRTFKKDFDDSLKAARLSRDEAVEIKDAMSLLKGDRTEVVTQLAHIDNVLGVIKGDVERLEQLSGIITEAAAESATVSAQAQAILNAIMAVNQKKKIAKTIISEDRTFEKTCSGIVRTITANEKQAVKFGERGKDKLGKPSSQLQDRVKDHQRISEIAGQLVELPEVSDETFAKFEKNAQDARVACDSAEIFEDSVNSSAQQSAACLDAAEKHVAVETSPEAQVAKTDCSPWPGTSAKWIADKQVVECWCPNGYIWDKDKALCLTKKDYAWDHSSCESSPGTHKVWNAARQVVECACPNGQFWNNNNRRCEVKQVPPPNTQATQDLLKGLQDLMKTATGGGTGGGSSGGGGGAGGGGGGGNYNECAGYGATPDSSCASGCRCPSGSCEQWGQGCVN